MTEHEPGTPTPGPTVRPRVLLVEDNDAASRGLTRLLEVGGFSVSSARDGVSALRTLQEAPPFDFVLTDLQLPDLDGREVARAARELPARPRIALITGWEPDPDLAYYATFGIEWVFVKPLDYNSLLNALREASEGKSPRDDSRPPVPGTP